MFLLQNILFGIMTALAVWYVQFRWRRMNLYRLAAKIHGPKGLPLFGVALKFIGKNCRGNKLLKCNKIQFN